MIKDTCVTVDGVMKVPQDSDGDFSRNRSPMEKIQGIALPKSSLSRHNPQPIYLNANTNTTISSINGTLIVHVEANLYNRNSVDRSTTTTTNNNNNFDSSNSNTTTPSYEQLSREFYQSYDPNVGLHTAAVLGGILVWLVLYVIYRTRVRKCVIRLVKKLILNKDELETKASDPEKDSGSGNNSSDIRNYVTPSIVIEASPPHSPSAYQQFHLGGQDCLSPYSLPGTGNEEGTIFQFPHPSQCGLPQELYQSHMQGCPDQTGLFLQLPKSETDIPSATAKWVQNMPLAAWSQQDFAGLMMSLQSHGLLAMQKPCSCPLVCPRTPQPLPLLELPNTWNKSLPVLSNSWSNQILSAYEAVINNPTRDKNIKDIINTKYKLKNNINIFSSNGNHNENSTFLNGKNKNMDSNRRHSHVGVNNQTDKNRKTKQCMKPPNISINIPSSEESYTHNNSFLFTRSPFPIPVTPTVKIQSSKDLQKHQRGRSSNASISSISSADALLASLRAPHIHISRPSSPRIPSPHLLSPDYDSTRRSGSNHFSWSNGDIKKYLDNTDSSRSRSVSPYSFKIPHDQYLSKHPNIQTPRDLKPRLLNNDKNVYQQRILCDNISNTHQLQNTAGGLFNPFRSNSDNNDSFNFFQNSPSPTRHNQRSLPTDFPLFLNYHDDQVSPSNESNRSSLGTPSRPRNPSPNLLQVPEPSNFFRPVTPEFGINKYDMDISNIGYQSSIHHCIHSDGNIAYSSSHYYPISPTVDNMIIRRHSTCAPEEINLLYCCDSRDRSVSSLGQPDSNNSSKDNSYFSYQPNNGNWDQSQYRNSTGMLDSDNYLSQRYCLYAHPSLKQSYSSVLMETKL